MFYFFNTASFLQLLKINTNEALAKQLGSLEYGVHVPKLWVPSPLRAHTRINTTLARYLQLAGGFTIHQKVHQKVEGLIPGPAHMDGNLSMFLSLFPFLYLNIWCGHVKHRINQQMHTRNNESMFLSQNQ